MKESLFNYRFEYENQKYIFNTNNNGLIQINNDIFTEEEREYLRVNRFWLMIMKMRLHCLKEK